LIGAATDTGAYAKITDELLAAAAGVDAVTVAGDDASAKLCWRQFIRVHSDTSAIRRHMPLVDAQMKTQQDSIVSLV